MPPPFRHGKTITRLRGVAADDGYRGTTTDWSTPDRLDIDGCAVAPLVEEEQLARSREGIPEAWTVYCPYGSDITARDRVELDGLVFNVDGDPGNWQSPFSGLRHGMTVRIVRVEG